MGKDITKNCYRFAILFTLLLTKNCLANPVIFDPVGDILKIGGAILINSSVDFVVLAIGYALIRRFYHVLSLKFIRYLIYVIIVGFVIDAVVYLLLNHMNIDPHMTSIPSVGFACILLAISNYILCRSFWELSRNKSAIIAMMMGLFTNPYIFQLFFG